MGKDQPMCWRNMIQNKTEQSLEQDHNADFYQTWGEDSLNWGWDITHVEEIWYIIKLNRVCNMIIIQTSIRLGGKQQKLGLGHNTCWRNMIHNKTEQSLEQDHNADLYQTWGETAETGVGTYNTCWRNMISYLNWTGSCI